MLSAHDLKKSYDSRVAVSGISIEMHAGGILGLLGPNGAGKSTTIQMLCGLLKPDQGEVKIDGQPDPTRASVRRKLGVAPQQLALYEDLTGAENVRFFGELQGLQSAKLEERVSRVLEFTGLKDRADHRARTYSGGMQRRLNLACALVHEPAVLLLDEPTVGVDPQSRNHIFENIEALAKSGAAILYTTHYMEEAERLCDRVAIMDQGKILAAGTLTELLAQHGGGSYVHGELERAPANAAELPGTLTGLELSFQSEKPMDEVNRLVREGHAFKNIHIERPNLEQVFLKLTGRRLRDE
jgi:ABC-2 type transport system ATP-binding protein